MNYLESEVVRGEEARRLALESYMKINPQKRDTVAGVDFIWPYKQSFGKKEGRQAAEAIHELRFALHDPDSSEAKAAAENYFATVYEPAVGATKVRISFSRQDYEKTQKLIRFMVWRKAELG